MSNIGTEGQPVERGAPPLGDIGSNGSEDQFDRDAYLDSLRNDPYIARATGERGLGSNPDLKYVAYTAPIHITVYDDLRGRLEDNEDQVRRLVPEPSLPATRSPHVEESLRQEGRRILPIILNGEVDPSIREAWGMSELSPDRVVLFSATSISRVETDEAKPTEPRESRLGSLRRTLVRVERTESLRSAVQRQRDRRAEYDEELDRLRGNLTKAESESDRLPIQASVDSLTDVSIGLPKVKRKLYFLGVSIPLVDAIGRARRANKIKRSKREIFGGGSEVKSVIQDGSPVPEIFAASAISGDAVDESNLKVGVVDGSSTEPGK